MQGGPPEDGFGGVNMYGMTETCTAFTCTRADDPLPIRLTTCGALMPENELKIVAIESGELVKPGEPGEICVKGPTVMRQYYKVDPATIFDDEGFFRTGDLGHVDDAGRLIFSQRIKDTIKTGGINVAPADIESKLVTLGGVVAAYAFPLPSQDRGEVVGAALVVVPGAEPGEEAILAHCKESLSGYKRPEGLLILSRGAGSHDWERKGAEGRHARSAAFREWKERGDVDPRPLGLSRGAISACHPIPHPRHCLRGRRPNTCRAVTHLVEAHPATWSSRSRRGCRLHVMGVGRRPTAGPS